MCVRLGLTGRHRTPVGPLLVDTPDRSLESRAMGSIAEVRRKPTLAGGEHPASQPQHRVGSGFRLPGWSSADQYMRPKAPGSRHREMAQTGLLIPQLPKEG